MEAEIYTDDQIEMWDSIYRVCECSAYYSPPVPVGQSQDLQLNTHTERGFINKYQAYLVL